MHVAREAVMSCLYLTTLTTLGKKGLCKYLSFEEQLLADSVEITVLN